MTIFDGADHMLRVLDVILIDRDIFPLRSLVRNRLYPAFVGGDPNRLRAFAQNDNVCHDIGARIFLERAAWQAERGD